MGNQGPWLPVPRGVTWCLSYPSRKDKHLLPTILSPSQASAPGLLSSPRKPSPSPPRGPASWLLEMGPQIRSVQSTSVQWLVAHSAAEWSEHRERSPVHSLGGKAAEWPDAYSVAHPADLGTPKYRWLRRGTVRGWNGHLGSSAGERRHPQDLRIWTPFLFFEIGSLQRTVFQDNFLQQSPLGCGP